MEVVSSPQSSIASSAARTPSRYLGLKAIAHWATGLSSDDHRKSAARPLKKRRGDKGLSQVARNVGQCCDKIATERRGSKTKSMPFIPSTLSRSETLKMAELVTEMILHTPDLVFYGTPPPPYHEAANDLPPEYLISPAISHTQNLSSDSAPKATGQSAYQPGSYIFGGPNPDISIDFNCSAGRRECPKKKGGSKKPTQEKWVNDDENDKTPPERQDGDEHGNGGGGAGDGGNNGGDGGDGDDKDDWAFSGGKKKNKKKKKKEEEEERERKEEEERKRKEEEERKRKEEEEGRIGEKVEEEEKKSAEEAAVVAPKYSLSWADEINDGKQDGEWGLATSSKKKKNKKGKPEPTPASVTDPSSFQEIQLDDNPPQLDLSYDTYRTGDDLESWGKTWKTGTDNATTDNVVVEDKGRNPWSSAAGEDTKELSFDFDFGATSNGYGNNTATEGKMEENDWQEFSTNKKNKKTKGKPDFVEALKPSPPEPEPGYDDSWGKPKKDKKKSRMTDETPKGADPLADPYSKEADVVDPGAAVSSKKDKKKKGKPGGEQHEDAAYPIVDGIKQPEVDDAWSGFSTKKDKKKKGKFNEDPQKEPDPPVEVESKPTESTPMELEDAWTTPAKKEKKKKKGKLDDYRPEADPPLEAESNPTAFNDTSSGFPANRDAGDLDEDLLKEAVGGETSKPTQYDESWSGLPSKKDKKKKGKEANLPVEPEFNSTAIGDTWSAEKDYFDKVSREEPDLSVEVDSKPTEIEDPWSPPAKKEKKKKKGKETNPPVDTESNPTTFGDTWSAKKDNFDEDSRKEPDLSVEVVSKPMESTPTEFDDTRSAPAKKDKKKKKGKEVNLPVDTELNSTALDDTRSTKKDKKNTGGFDEDSRKVPDPSVEVEPKPTECDDSWSGFPAKKDKKKRKGKEADPSVKAESNPAAFDDIVSGLPVTKDKMGGLEEDTHKEPYPHVEAESNRTEFDNTSTAFSIKKDKKKKKKGRLDEDAQKESDPPIEAEPTRTDFDDSWSALTDKKDKKKGKSVGGPQEPNPLVEAGSNLDDTRSTLSSKKDKKKKGKSIGDPQELNHSAEAESKRDIWSTWSSKKDKKENYVEDVKEPDRYVEVDLNPDDAWSLSGKKEKKKKGKPVEDPQEPDPLVGRKLGEDLLKYSTIESEPKQTGVDDTWSSPTSKKDKKKKGKSGENTQKEHDPLIEAESKQTEVNDTWFDFTSNKDKGGKLSGGCILAELEPKDVAEDYAWNSHPPKKNKKKKNTSGEEKIEPEPTQVEETNSFNVAFSEDKKSKVADGPLEELDFLPTEPSQMQESLDWAKAGTKKDKKKRGKTAEDLFKAPDPLPVDTEAKQADVGDSWTEPSSKDKPADDLIKKSNPAPVNAEAKQADVGDSRTEPTSKKDRKKKGKPVDDLIQKPDPPPVDTEAKQADADSWAAPASKKDKKKKGKMTEKSPEEVEPPSVEPEVELKDVENLEIADTWSPSTTKKSKKKKGKTIEEQPKELLLPLAELEPQQPETTAWTEFSSEKDKKKSKLGEEQSNFDPPVIDFVTGADDTFAAFSTIDKKKDKTAVEELKNLDLSTFDCDRDFDEWNDWDGASKKDKEKKSKNVAESSLQPEPEPSVEAAGLLDDLPTTGKKKKGKKTTAEPPVIEEAPGVSILDPQSEPVILGSSLSKDKRKLKKTSKTKEEAATNQADVKTSKVHDILATFENPKDKKHFAKTTDDNEWGWSTKGKDKKNAVVEDPFPVSESQAVFEVTSEAVENNSLGTWGSIKKDKKSKKEEVIEMPPQSQQPELQPSKETSGAAENNWLGPWGTATKRDKKSKNEQPPQSQQFELELSKETSGAPENNWFGWGTSTKKDKKSKNEEAIEQPPQSQPSESELPKETSGAAENKWPSTWGTATKRDKKSKKEEEQPPQSQQLELELAKETSGAPGNNWLGTWGTNTKKKDTKSKKEEVVGQSPQSKQPELELHKEREEVKEARKAPEEDAWAVWGITKKEKKKKSTTAAAIEETVPEPIDSTTEFSNRGASTNKAKDKKALKSETSKPEPETRKELESIDPAADDSNWGAWTTTKSKGKSVPKSETSKPEPETRLEPEPTRELEAVVPEEFNNDFWDEWAALSSKEKKKKQREAKKNHIPLPSQEALSKPLPVVEPVAELPPRPPPPAPSPPATAEGDAWGAFSAKSPRGTKKSPLSKSPKVKAPPILETDDPLRFMPGVKGLRTTFGTPSTTKPKTTTTREEKGGKPEKSERPQKQKEERAAIPAPLPLVDLGVDPKAPEAPTAPAAPPPAKATSKLKSTDKQPVTERIKALGEQKKREKEREKEKEKAREKEKGREKEHHQEQEQEEQQQRTQLRQEKPTRPFETFPPPSPPDRVPAPAKDDPPPAKKATSTSKSKSNKTISAKKQAAAAAVTVATVATTATTSLPYPTKASKESIPGSFPAEHIEDDILDFGYSAPYETLTSSTPPSPSLQPTYEHSSKKAKTRDNIRDFSYSAAYETFASPLSPSPQPASEQSSKKAKTRDDIFDFSYSAAYETVASPTPPSPSLGASEQSSKRAKATANILDFSYSAAYDTLASPTPPSPSPRPAFEQLSEKAKTSFISRSQSPNLMDNPPPAAAPEAETGAPPTPPAEPDQKPTRKERTKLEQSAGASWSFWVVGPRKPVKKETKAKEDSDIPKAKITPRPALVRSKSAVTARPKPKEPQNEGDKSPSDKEKRPEPRTVRTPRNMGLATLFMGPPPTRTKSGRRIGASASKPPSRRQSEDVDNAGLPSPPPDNKPEIPAKAAKVMGLKASKSKRESMGSKKRRSGAPDDIVDDDMVLVNGNGDIDMKESRRVSKHSRSKSKRESRARDADLQDDIVMVDPGQATPGPEVISGPDDIAFVEAPRESRTRRSSLLPKKPEGTGFMGLFGSLRRSTRPELSEHRRSRSYRDEDARHMTETDREERRARREEKRRHSAKPDTDGEGFTTDPGPAGGTSPEIEEAEAKRAARKARHATRRAREAEIRETELREAELREAELREAEGRRARQERTREKRAREEEEREERRREEKKARRAAHRAKEEREAEVRDKAAERHERRRTRDSEEMNGVSRHLSKSDRRHSYMADKNLDRQYPEDYAAERRHHRSHRSGDEAIRSRFRKPAAREPAEPPYFPAGGKDKTSSWVNQQMAVQPEAPPLVPTMVDVPPAAEAHSHSLSSDEEARRKIRHQARRRTKHPGPTDEEMEDLRPRRRESKRADHKSSSASGDYDRDRGNRAFGGRYGPRQVNGGEKRTSWFKKLTRS